MLRIQTVNKLLSDDARVTHGRYLKKRGVKFRSQYERNLPDRRVSKSAQLFWVGTSSDAKSEPMEGKPNMLHSENRGLILRGLI
jgi:hypothetical protein